MALAAGEAGRVAGRRGSRSPAGLGDRGRLRRPRSGGVRAERAGPGRGDVRRRRPGHGRPGRALRGRTGGEVADLAGRGRYLLQHGQRVRGGGGYQPRRRMVHDHDGLEEAGRNNNVPMLATCRSAYAGILVATGRWEQAERELAAADGFAGTIQRSGCALPPSWRCCGSIQGRLADAEAALTSCEGHPAAGGRYRRDPPGRWPPAGRGRGGAPKAHRAGRGFAGCGAVPDGAS